MPRDLSKLVQEALSDLQSGRVQPAEQKIRIVLDQEPNHRDARLLLGTICARTKQLDRASELLSGVLLESPDEYDALFWLSVVKKAQGAYGEATALLQRILDRNPDDVPVLNSLGLCWLSAREPSRAVDIFERVIALDPRAGAAYHNLGRAYVLLERRSEALEAFRKAVELDPQRIDNFLELHNQLRRMAAWDDSIACLEAGRRHHPRSVEIVMALAGAYSVARDKGRAESLYKTAIAMDPCGLHAYGMWLQEEGRFEESVKHLSEAIKVRPSLGVAYFGLTEAKHFELDHKPLPEQIRKAETHPRITHIDRMYLAYAAGRSYEHAKDYEHAMEAFDNANRLAYRLYNEGRVFDLEALSAHTEQLRSFYSQERIRTLRQHGSPSKLPILVVGMIRSGTTLLEQILSSHPQIGAAGEMMYWMIESDRVPEPTAADLPKLAEDYEFVLRGVAGDAERITDKMPLNYDHLGQIHCTFPNARIIHIRRNPLDTCLSIYTTHFGGGPNFAYRQENIVAFYRAYLERMEHWREVLPPDRFTEVDYEDLIDDREPVIRRLLEFCDVPWSDACLHHEDNASAINTPSRWQARQPVYRSSVARWKRYEPWLGALAELRDVRHPHYNPKSLTLDPTC